MATITEIREALAERLASIEQLRTHAGFPGQLNAPAAVVTRRSTQFDSSMGGDDLGSDDQAFLVRVFVAWSAGNEATQENLDAYLARSGPQSIRAAVEADPTLGGVVDSAAAVAVTGDRLVEYPPGSGAQYLNADVVVEVL